MVASIYILLKSVHRSHGLERTRLNAIFWSIIGALIINMITNAAVPLFNGSFILTNLGPISVLLIVGGLFYSVVKHQLFDVRAVVARSLAYLFSTVALGLFYGGITFFVLGKLFYGDISLSFEQEVLFAAMAAVITMAFQPLRRFFDIATRRVFYKDGYDSAAFLGEFNRLLVASLGLDNLLNNASQAIADCLKANASFFVIDDHIHKGSRIVGTHKIGFTPQELKQFRKEVDFQKDAIILTDFIEQRQGLKRLLGQKDIGLVSVIQANNDHGKTLGYLVLGIKKNGNPYTTQDTRLIEIITGELSIAILNNLRFEEIQNFNKTMEAEVQEATAQLRRTNEKLRQMDQTKDDFISMASHQLRTPLTSVKGYVSMVLDGDAGPVSPLQRKLLNQSYVSSQRMVYLISDLLNVSRLRTGKFIIEPIPSNLARVIKDEIEQLQETAKGRNLELTYDKPEHFPTLMLDETKIRQVIMNFIDNAIYYTPSGGHISVNLADKKDTIEFTVVDDGIGVAKHEQPHLFTKFFRAHNAKRARPDGTGLGLFMAKKVIVAQGGALIFRSQEGKGSTFGFTFAKAKLEQPQPKPAMPDAAAAK
jgi:signal transduction histidine kinase